MTSFFSTLLNKNPSLAPIILRFALSAVFIWFGWSQFFHPDNWTSYVPVWTTNLSGLKALTIVYLNGCFELLMGSLLVLGIYLRIVASILFLHLFSIAWQFGFTDIAIRDYGLAFATLSIALNGQDRLCLK